MLYITRLKAGKSQATSSKSRRELVALRATAIDAGRYPIIAAHWPGLLIVDGRLACHDNSPIKGRFKVETAHG